MEKKPFVTLEQLKEIEKTYPTPYHIYDEKGFMENARKVNEAFSWNKGFREYFAVKAEPNPFIIKKLKEVGCGVDCSSYTELMIADKLGFRDDEIMFSSNETPEGEFGYCAKLGGIINLDDITMIDFMEKEAGIPETVSCRYNPGGVFEACNGIMDNPGDAKYGMTTEQIFEAFKILKAKGAPAQQLIHSLESYTSQEIDEKWLYELAELYSIAGMADRCVETCDKIMLMFGLGKYVDKAMELKIQYAPLTTYQMDLVENRDKYEAKLRAVEQEYGLGGGQMNVPEQDEEYYDDGNPGMDMPEEPYYGDLQARMQEAEVQEGLAREMSRMSYEEPPAEQRPRRHDNTRVLDDIRRINRPVMRNSEYDGASIAAGETAAAGTAYAGGAFAGAADGMAGAAYGAADAVVHMAGNAERLASAMPRPRGMMRMPEMADEVPAEPVIEEDYTYGNSGYGESYGESSYGDASYEDGSYGDTSYGGRAYGGDTYGKPGYGENSYGEPVYGENAYGEAAYGENAYREPGYGEHAYGDASHGQSTYGETAYGENTYGDSAYGENNHEGAAYGDNSYGEAAYGENTSEEPAYGGDLADDVAYGASDYDDPEYGKTAYGDTAYGKTAYGDTAYGDAAYSDEVTGESVSGESVSSETAYSDSADGESTGDDPVYGETAYDEPETSYDESECDNSAYVQGDSEYSTQEDHTVNVTVLNKRRTEDDVLEIEDLEEEEEEPPVLNHLMIEARTPEKGLKIAVEALKQIHNESGIKNPVAKITGEKLSKRGVLASASKLAGKDLVIEEAGDLTPEALEELYELMNHDNSGMIVVLIDNPKQMENLHRNHPRLASKFECSNAATSVWVYPSRYRRVNSFFGQW